MYMCVYVLMYVHVFLIYFCLGSSNYAEHTKWAILCNILMLINSDKASEEKYEMYLLKKELPHLMGLNMFK